MSRIACVVLALLLGLSWPGRAADVLRWDAARNRVDAEIESWTVPQLLGRVAAVTGWQVYIDPTISNTIPTKFRDKTAGDALQRLLGTLNYALAPDTNGSRLYVFRNSRDEATTAVAPTPDAKKSKSRIENELIVTLKPGEKIDELARKLGAKVVGRVDDLNAYRLRFDNAKSTEAARSSLQSDPSVASVEDNYSMPRPEMPQSIGGSPRSLGLNPQSVPDSKYVIVALLDTAVQGKEAGLSDFLLPEISVAEPCDSVPSSLTHGTAMAATVLRSLAVSGKQRNTTVRILPIDVYGCSESTTTFDVGRGMYEAAKAGASIINASLGSDGDSPFLRNTAENTANAGVKIFAAAGNEPVTTPVYPAAYPWVKAVTAAGDKPDSIAPWANHGSFVDIIAPGSSVVGFNNQQFVVTGTSTSTAIASGVAAAAAESARTSGAASGSTSKKAP